MVERAAVLRGEQERKLSRRALMKAFGAAALVVVAGSKLREGVSLDKPPLTLRVVYVERTDDDVRLLSRQSPEGDTEELITMTAENQLLYEPFGDFFTSGKKFNYIHRANSTQFIHDSYELGADLFDIDANDVQGTVYAEHGIIPQYEGDIGGLHVAVRLPMVIDVNEKELKLGMPDSTYADLVACVSSLNTSERPLAVSTELKRGAFDPETVTRMLAIHRRYGVPAIMYSAERSQLEMMGDEIAQRYGSLM